MERNEGHLVLDSGVVKAVVLVVAMLTASGTEMAAIQPTVNPSENGVNRMPDVARIEPDVAAEVVLIDSGNL